MSERPAFDGARQRDVLTALQKRAGIDATIAARSVHLSYPQYNRYLWGQLPLRSDHFGPFADTYGVDVLALVRLLFTDVPIEAVVPPVEWDIRTELRKRGETDEAQIEQFAETHEGKDIVDQRAAVQDYHPTPTKTRRHRSA